MKNIIILLVIFFTVQHSYSKEIEIPSYLVESSLDKTLKKDQSKFIFTFPNLLSEKFLIHYSIDNIEKRVYLKKGDTLSILSIPGKHDFQFFTSEYYQEIHLKKEPIKNQFTSVYVINFKSTLTQVQCEKPVIYLYPEKTTDIEVQLTVKGDLIMTYPEYKNKWRVKSHPNGDLEVNDKTYNYLFWESNLVYQQDSDLANSGFIVPNKNTVQFLEKHLTKAGLNSKEKADFITYWGPRLLQNNFNYIRFEFNDSCNQFAELKISPKPDHINRIYLTWRKSDGNERKTSQIITPMKRNGFDVLEWGGIEISETIIVN